MCGILALFGNKSSKNVRGTFPSTYFGPGVEPGQPGFQNYSGGDSW